MFLQRSANAFFNITEQLIREKTVQHSGQNGRFVDIVKDVVNLAPIRFIASYLVRIHFAFLFELLGLTYSCVDPLL